MSQHPKTTDRRQLRILFVLNTMFALWVCCLSLILILIRGHLSESAQELDADALSDAKMEALFPSLPEARQLGKALLIDADQTDRQLRSLISDTRNILVVIFISLTVIFVVNAAVLGRIYKSQTVKGQDPAG